MRDDLFYWLALHREFIWKFTPRELYYIKRSFNTIQDFWKATDAQLRHFAEEINMKKSKIEYFIKRRNLINFDIISKTLNEIRDKGIKILTCFDDDYPDLLKSPKCLAKLSSNIFIYNPRMLFITGSRINFTKCVSIVGTRRCSEEGFELAYHISNELAKKGITVVSGMAIGIDTAAHKGAIDSNGTTIAVLPWLDPIYPKENTDLANDIKKHGCLLSEFYRKDFVKIRTKWFLERDKIISAISKKILIVETGRKGGSIRVARIANMLKREIYVCEPQIDDEDKWLGFNRLRKYYNAKVFKSINDIITNL